MPHTPSIYFPTRSPIISSRISSLTSAALICAPCFPAARSRIPGSAFSHRDEQKRVFVSGVIDGQPAARAGVLVGDEILAVDGAPFRPVESFRGKVGATVTLSIRRAASGPVFGLSVGPQGLHPNEMFLRGMEASARIIRGSHGARIYVHVWSYAGYVYQRMLEQLIGTGVLRNADALIWDLRDGWGGAAPGYLDLFDQRRPTVELIGRNGGIHLEGVTWRKPVAMLINGGTRSGKEILAYGFKKHGIGELIGMRTMGAVLAATVFMMRDGSMLLLAVDNVRADDVRLGRSSWCGTSASRPAGQVFLHLESHSGGMLVI
jgi:carboxyl-terminal processing protease